jgi:alcohol dehydrogenase class IV
LRNILLKASNIAGLAFSNTKTAAAHSISYPLTINYSIPHGLATFLPLLSLLRINKGAIENELDLIIKELEMSDLSELENDIKRIPSEMLKINLNGWGVAQSDLLDLAEQSFTQGRMDNNIVELNRRDVYNILQSIY